MPARWERGGKDKKKGKRSGKSKKLSNNDGSIIAECSTRK